MQRTKGALSEQPEQPVHPPGDEAPSNEFDTTRERRMLRAAGALLVLLGAGHVVVMSFVAGARMVGWVTMGPWAAVPLTQGSDPTVTSLQDSLAFWGGLGSFAMPLIVLGALLWWGADRGFVPPAWAGWVLVAWFAICAVLLVPSPNVVGIVPGVLIVLAARRARGRRRRR